MCLKISGSDFIFIKECCFHCFIEFPPENALLSAKTRKTRPPADIKIENDYNNHLQFFAVIWMPNFSAFAATF